MNRPQDQKNEPFRPLVSVVIPAYNAAEQLPATLRALAAQQEEPGPVEVLVVDDGSTDGTADAARSSGLGTLRVVSLPRCGGPARARNAGIEAARGELVVFTDADCIPDPRFLAEICRPLLADPALAAVKGAYRTAQRSLAARFAQAEFEERYRMMARLETIDFVDTYAAAFRRSVLLEAGGFDPSFPVPNNEDVDLSWRLAAAGHRMAFTPGAVVTHRHRPGLAGYFTLKVRRGFWRMKVYRRYPDKAAGDSYTPLTMKVQLAAMAILPVLLAFWPLWPAAGGLLAVLLLVFLLSTLPLSVASLGRDPLLALVTPLLLCLRAVALLAGMVAGLVRFRPFIGGGAG